METPSLRETLNFVRAAYARAGAGRAGAQRWVHGMEVVNLLPSVLPGIMVSHAERQVALLRDVFRNTRETEDTLLDAGFPAEVVASVHRLTRFDAGFSYLEHMGVVAGSNDLAAKRVAMAVLLREEQRAEPGEDAAKRERRRKAMEMLQRGLGY